MRTSRTLAAKTVGAYANALFEAALADNVVDAVAMQLDAVARLLRGNAPLRDALRDSHVAIATRVKMVEDVLSGLNGAVVKTVGVMVERGDLELLSRVIDAFGSVAEERRGIVAVDVTTAVELTDTLRASLTSKLAADLGRDVVLREKVDASIIGGLIVDAHGKRIDASIASQLENARRVLSTAHTGGEA